MKFKYKCLLTAFFAVITITFAARSSFATGGSIINISLSDAKEIVIELPEELPEINIDDVDLISMPTVAELSADSEFEQWNSQTIEAKIVFPQTDELVLPANEYELDENWVSENEVDEEDLTAIETLKATQVQNTDESDIPADVSSFARSLSPVDASYRLSMINNKDSFSLQNQTGRTGFVGDNIGEEYIDPLTGNLIVTETDLVLPGVDGLDLKLSRYYSLAQAELYTKTAGICNEAKTYTLPEGWYVVTEEIYNTETEQTSTTYYAYSTLESAQIKIDEIETRDTCNDTYMYDAWYDISSEGDTVTFNNYYTSEITSASYQTMRNNLGAGWSWSFPSVQAVKSNYNDYDEFVFPEALYYHDGKGNVMEIDFSDSSNCYFTNYVGHDLSFEILGYMAPDICSTARIDYMVEDSDCTEYYFGPHGEIRSIIDIYGNKIEFSYTYEDFYGAENMPVISGITDTIGRFVNFEYTFDDEYEYIEVTVTSPSEDERSIELLYTKKAIDISYMGEYFSTEAFLERVTYPNGDVTEYYPAPISGERNYAQPLKFTFADKTFESDYVVSTSGYANTLVYLLGNIVRPHSNTYYYYDLCERNLGHSGVCQAYRVDERGDNMLVVRNNDIINEYSSNVTEYDYSLDYTGYPLYYSPESIPDGVYVCRTKEFKENADFVREFYKRDDAVLEHTEEVKYTNPVGSDLFVTHTVEDYLFKMPKVTKSTYSNENEYTYDSYRYYDMSTYGKSYGRPLLETEEVDYNTAVGAERVKHGISYTYYDDTGFVASKSWYQNDNSECTETYVYDSNGRLASYVSAENSVVSYDYEYTNGKVSKKTTTSENDTGTTVVIENYTPATSFAFPATIVKTVTANNITKTETTSYTYDMLYGVVTSMTDNDGNTTYYEYDSLGRPTRIIYPTYSTYSAYGTKNIKIMPVENITYETVARDYDGVLYSGESLISQRITNTLSYYDVSSIENSVPTAIDVSSLTKTFYAIEQDYYLGTGELIESNILDTVNGSATVNTTTYYYDTGANTVSVVNPKGNTTITQYDGLGREVKFTDEFDNYHITEYNISSSGAGFKALSYFVPLSDRNSKQNVTEYTYDRLGRATKEKGYSDYPNTSVEVRYEYDFVGNVIGIIDANNNLNEDGYTQTNTYDKLNRVTSSKNANNEIIRNTYDSLGNIKKQTITDSNGTQSILYQRSYDGDSKIVSDTDNAGNSNLYEYDDMGRLINSCDKDLKTNSFDYNETGTLDSTVSTKPGDSLIARNYALENPYGADVVYDVRGTYDENSGQYRGFVNEITRYMYSPEGKLIEQNGRYADSTGINNVLFEPHIKYIYDSTGNIISAQYGNVDEINETVWGFAVHYEYDKNRIARVQIDGSLERNTSDSVNVKYEYYDDGKLKSVTYPALTDGSLLKSEYVYDGLSRLTSLTNYRGTEVLSRYAYTYDSNGNILTTTENVGTTQNSVAYTYDKLNRISSVAGTKGADSYYEYDARGNRKLNFEQTDFLSEENAVFTYNAEDKLCYAQVGNNTMFADYSANGYRYIKSENSNYPEFNIYDSNGRLHALVKPVSLLSNGSETIVMYPTTQYIWGADRVLAKIDVLTGNTCYYLYNGHGDIVQIVDTSGNIVNQYDYDVWGNFLKKEETIQNHFTYFGQTYDEATGLYYLRARYYDPATGRFTQQDPAEDGYNWFVYGNQNPIKYIDLNGFRSKEASDKIIRDNASHIISAAQEFGVNPGILAAIIYAEQRLNVDWKDDNVDPIAVGLLDVSLGISQVKISTAIFVENEGYISKTNFYEWHGNNMINNRRQGIINKLFDAKENIRYAAAYLKYFQNEWKSVYPEIDGRTAILATLYNLGHRRTSPNSNPESNDFGIFARENYYHVRGLIGLE